MKCSLCPRRCNAERDNNKNLNGVCKMPLKPVLSRAALHMWEEPCISGKNGSGTVFFSGCSLQCVFCQNFSVSRGETGNEVSVERLAEIFRELEEKGAHNINLVTPTHYAPAIKQALGIYRPKIPIVYNSGGYELPETLKMLEGLIDIYLLDLKYLSAERSLRYSKAADYPQYAKAALLEAYRQKEKCVFENGIMKSGVIVRHLLLPQGTREAMAVFDWVKENLPNAYFSIMSQYTPCGKAEDYPEINRKVTRREYDKVIDYIAENGFENCFIQERSSAKEEYIPPFDLSGI